MASGSIGQALATSLIQSGKLINIAKTCVKPFYYNKSQLVQKFIHIYFKDTDFAVHKSEGSIFIWLYLPSLKISTIEFYQILKTKGVFVMPGEYFFFGQLPDASYPLLQEHPHYSKCLRINYARPDDELDYGIKTISEIYKQYGK